MLRLLLVAHLKGLYDRALFLQAHRMAAAMGPYRDWRGAPALVLAGRLAGQLGGSRQSGILLDLAFKADPSEPGARYFCALRIFQWRGPLSCWQMLRREGPLESGDEDIRGSWLALHASALAALRDFERAWAWYERAARAAPGSPWVVSRKAELLSREDRHAEALAAAEESLAAFPWHRAGVLAKASELTLLDRVPEAVELLAEADRHLESGDAAGHRAPARALRPLSSRRPPRNGLLDRREMDLHASPRRLYPRQRR